MQGRSRAERQVVAVPLCAALQVKRQVTQGLVQVTQVTSPRLAARLLSRACAAVGREAGPGTGAQGSSLSRAQRVLPCDGARHSTQAGQRRGGGPARQS